MLIAPASILAETEWLERLAEAEIEAACWTAIPNRIAMIAAAAALDALVALEAGRRGMRLSRGGGTSCSPLRIAGDHSGRDRSDARRKFGGRPGRRAAPPSRAGQGHRRLHGAPRRAANFTADISPPRVHRDHSQPDEPHLHCRGRLSRAFLPVSPPVLADDRSAPVPGALDSGRVRRRVGQTEISGIALGRHSRFLGGQCRPQRHFRQHGRRLEPVCRRGMAAHARGRGGPRRTGIGELRLLAAHAGEARQRPTVYFGFDGARPTRWRGCSTAPRAAISSISCSPLRCSASRTGFCFWPRSEPRSICSW